ncbi:MAG: ABC transporter ATP-binding protein [Chloroflexi bacterium]|nr:ABC transporter ATP-binding protein [Chloroflexota bacterium]MYD66479.1 ABC transporter ATP-binding protein [Chloroflexota bacterium]
MASEAARVEVQNVSRWYGDVVAVNDISFTLEPGITGLLGPNGAGKSTLLHMISGFLRPSVGVISVLGATAWRNPEMFRRVGLVPERESVYSFLGARAFAEASARLHGLPDPEDAARRAIARVELEDAQDRAMGGYSKGMRQRAKIAAALVHDPEVLVLDEPFNGTDPRQRLQLMEMLRRMAAEGCTILFSSHILEEVERLAENVLVIVNGRLAASGDFRQIRRLMTDRPHTFELRTSDNRALAAALVGLPHVSAVELTDSRLDVRTTDFGAFTAAIAAAVRDSGVTLQQLRPADESLESVFSYLVGS